MTTPYALAPADLYLAAVLLYAGLVLSVYSWLRGWLDMDDDEESREGPVEPQPPQSTTVPRWRP